MKLIDFIVSYIRDEATLEERQRIKDMFIEFKTPPLEPEKILERLLMACREKVRQGAGSLEIVKYIKDVTAWGLKDCKEWFDAHVKP